MYIRKVYTIVFANNVVEQKLTCFEFIIESLSRKRRRWFNGVTKTSGIVTIVKNRT